MGCASSVPASSYPPSMFMASAPNNNGNNNTCCVDPGCDGCCGGQCGRARGICRRNCFLGCLVYVFVFLSWAAFWTGVVFLGLMGDDARGNAISSFNAASSAWPNASRPFANLSLVIATGDPGLTSPLERTAAVDPFPDTGGGVVVPTLGVHYEATFGIFTPRSFSPGATDSLTVNTVTAAGDSRVSPAAGLQLFMQKSETSGSGSSRHTSTYFYCLSAICAAVNDAGQITGGCARDDNLDSVSITGLSQSNCNSNTYSTFVVPVAVRSDRDPYVIAMQATRGTLNFGLSQSSKLVVGAVCLGVGALIFISLCLCIKSQAPPSRVYYPGYPGPQGVPPMALDMAASAPPPQQVYDLQNHHQQQPHFYGQQQQQQQQPSYSQQKQLHGSSV